MRYITTTKPRSATGLVAEVYRQVKREFGLLADLDGNSPFLAHSPCPELLAGMWSALYETVIADGKLTRADKEAVAATVSSLNDCPFCLEVHALAAAMAGDSRDGRALLSGSVDEISDERRMALVRWAASTREPESDHVTRPPFTETEAPEAIGTAVLFHYINRVVEVLQVHGSMSTGPAPLRIVSSKAVALVARRAIRAGHPPGRTLHSLEQAPVPPDLAWSAESSTIGPAWARFAAAIQTAGAAVLNAEIRESIKRSVVNWNGEEQPLDGEWVQQAVSALPPESAATARLGLLVALAPYRVSDGAVAAFRQFHPGDDELVGAVAWSAFTAARRVGCWLWRSRPGT